MRCDCCNAQLSDSESTAKFRDSGEYANMCINCRGFLPPEIVITTRPDLVITERQRLAAIATDLIEESEDDDDEKE